MINLVRRHASDAAIAFTSSPMDILEAAARWINIRGMTGPVID